MTWIETEKLAQECINQSLSEKELKNVAKNLPFFDSCNFVVIMKKKGINISV